MMAFTSPRIQQRQVAVVRNLGITLNVSQIEAFARLMVYLASTYGASGAFDKFVRGVYVHRTANVDKVMKMFVFWSRVNGFPVT